MKKELIIKKCLKCGAIIKVIEDCNCESCGITCCNETMKTIKPNSVDAAIEKHVPTYEFKGEKLIVKVNHVMDEDHFIEWICLKTENKEEFVYLKPHEEATSEFLTQSGTLYAYCNKHGLWQTTIEK